MIAKRKLIFVICGCALLLAIALSAYFIWRPVVNLHPEIMVSADEVLPHLQDGDIICRLGDRVWSSFIRRLSNDDRRFSHVGIARVRDGNVSVINAECLVDNRTESVNEVTLSDFLEVARAIGVYRANFMDGATISDNALEFLGRPFDWDFDHDDDSKIYCTELLHVIIMQHAPDRKLKEARISGLGRLIIPLEAISNSNDFDEVLYISKI